ncbi:MAG TPA: GxxExxY protein [Candidatus Koribacter sp.]|jgi:GxxExxY protein
MLSKDEVQRIADDVVGELGSDYAETIYQEAFLVELRLRGYQDYDRERVLPVTYKKQTVGCVRADVVLRKDSEEVVLEMKIGSEDDTKEKIKNELRAYLRAMNVQDGKSRKGFVVTFPCTANKKQAEAPATAATVEEVIVEEPRAGAGGLSDAVGKLLRVVSKV